MASEGQQTNMPDKHIYIEIEKHNTKLPCPFVTYGDIECLTTNSNNAINGTYHNNGIKAHIRNINRAVMC